MEKILQFTENDIKQIIAERFNIDPDSIIFIYYSNPNSVNAQIREKTELNEFQQKEDAKWRVWAGWRGNHDKRIEDAICSNCGYTNPTVYGIESLPKVCPFCKRKMGIEEV